MLQKTVINDGYNKGTRYLDAKKYEKALQFLKREPLEFKEKYLNMGNAYRGLNKIDLAAAAYLKAADESLPSYTGKRGKYPLALNNLGLLCHRKKDDLAAIQFYDSALLEDPSHVDTLWNKSIAMLRMGCSGADIDWDLAWTLYEYRFQKGTRVDPCLRWMGGPCRAITVLAEQGYGDKWMFYRYLWALRAETGGDVLVQCPEDMFQIVREMGFEPVHECVGLGIPVCSLAWKYGLDVSGEYLGGWNGGSGIGVVWSGSTTHSNNANRSTVPGYFRGLLEYDNVVSLNAGFSTPDFKCVVDSSWESKISVLRGLKLVVTIDTAIVHLCGAIGVPCIMIQPLCETDFRWGNPRYKENTFDNVWHRSVSVVENPGWDKVFGSVMPMVEEYYNAG